MFSWFRFELISTSRAMSWMWLGLVTNFLLMHLSTQMKSLPRTFARYTRPNLPLPSGRPTQNRLMLQSFGLKVRVGAVWLLRTVLLQLPLLSS